MSQNDPYAQNPDQPNLPSSQSGPSAAPSPSPQIGQSQQQLPGERPKKQGRVSQAVFVIRNKCTDKTLVTTNFAACGLLTCGVVLRFWYMFDATQNKPTDYNGFLFFLITCMQLFFTVLLGLSLLPLDNKYSVWTRVFFNFLDYYVGRGIYILFIAVLSIENGSAFEIIFFFVLIGIAVVDLVVGVQEWKVRKEAMEGNQQSAGASSAQTFQKQVTQASSAIGGPRSDQYKEDKQEQVQPNVQAAQQPDPQQQYPPQQQQPPAQAQSDPQNQGAIANSATGIVQSDSNADPYDV